LGLFTNVITKSEANASGCRTEQKEGKEGKEVNARKDGGSIKFASLEGKAKNLGAGDVGSGRNFVQACREFQERGESLKPDAGGGKKDER